MSSLFVSLVFGSIGFGVFKYGKRASSTRCVIGGIALMVYPYFVSNTWLCCGIGAAICAALFFFRD